METDSITNPHFDDNLVIWKDEYSGRYKPVDYSQQFDHEWRLFLEDRVGFRRHTGVETDDLWINDRIFDLTGVEHYIPPSTTDPTTPQDRNLGGRQYLDLKFSANRFGGSRCLDLGCGAGRWTRALLALGAQVKSVDLSEHALQSVRRFNEDVERINLFEIAAFPHLHEAFDFTICWGVVMCTHDPKVAFENVARTVRNGGGCYLMVYAPTLHNSPDILRWRRHYHKNLKTFEEKLAFAYDVADRPENAINYLDMLNTFYNWVIEEETIHHWYTANGFMDVITLNASERNPCCYHVFGRKRKFAPPLRDDHGDLIPRPTIFDPARIVKLKGPFLKETGNAWQVSLAAFGSIGDTPQHPYKSTLLLIEDGTPLWSRHVHHNEIREYGRGRYSHWLETLLFSTSDNTDPNKNNRQYGIVFSDTSL